MPDREIIQSINGNPTGRKFWFRVFLLLCRLLLRITVNGAENIPRNGPLVIVINHIGLLDPVAVLATFPRLVIPMAKKEAFDMPLLGRFMKMFGTIPVHRDGIDVNAIKMALKVLKQGGVLLLAPEGTRSSNHKMQPAKDGVAMLAMRSNANILPIAVTGTSRIKTHFTRLKRVPITLTVGTPFRIQLSNGRKRPTHSEMSALTDQVMYRVAALLPAEYRGVYSNLENVSDTYLGST